MSREAMKQALEALESDPITHAGLVNRKQAIAVLRQALETEQKPVAWITRGKLTMIRADAVMLDDTSLPLYIAPPKKEWVGLTYEEIQIVASKKWWDWEDSFDIEGFSRAIERVLKEKNHG